MSDLKQKHIGCKSWLCHQCQYYQKFLSVSSMQDLCWNRGCFYEKLEGKNENRNRTIKR